jgi:hypothetical protein
VARPGLLDAAGIGGRRPSAENRLQTGRSPGGEHARRHGQAGIPRAGGDQVRRQDIAGWSSHRVPRFVVLYPFDLCAGQYGCRVTTAESWLKTNSGTVPLAGRRRSTALTCATVCVVRVAEVVRCTPATAVQAVRRYPVMAVSWYSQPGVVLLDPRQ